MSKSLNKGVFALMGILVAVLIVVILGGGIFAWQKGWLEKGKTGVGFTNWKTYESEELKIEFKYPRNWTVDKVEYQTPAQQIRGETPGIIGVKLYPSGEIRGNDFIDIGGKQVSCEPSQNHTKCFYLSSIDNFTFTDSKNPEILDVFDSFVKTIWTTYRNEEYGFEIKYPGELAIRLVGRNDIGDMGVLPFLASVQFTKINTNNKIWAELAVRDFNRVNENWCEDVGGTFDGQIEIAGQKQSKCLHPEFGAAQVSEYSVLVGQRDNLFFDFLCGESSESGTCDQILSTFKFIKADETSNWQTYRDDKYGFEVKYPDTEDVLLVAQGDGKREFLFGGVSCGYSEEESNVLGVINFYPVIEGGFANPDYGRNYTKADCDELVTRFVLHGRFCTDKNLTKYQAWCDDGSETSDYHRYDIFLACSWPRDNGRIRCNQLFNQILSTFKFLK
jgi:hypothetical protein